MDFCLLPKNITKNIGANISKKLKEKYSLRLLDHAKKSVAHAIKNSSEKNNSKKPEVTGDSIANKIADKITKVSKSSPQNDSESETEIPKESHIFPEEKQKTIN